jgi:hypothetical protein
MDTRNGRAQPAIDIANIRIRFGSGSRAAAHRTVLVHRVVLVCLVAVVNRAKFALNQGPISHRRHFVGPRAIEPELADARGVTAVVQRVGRSGVDWPASSSSGRRC